MQYNPKEAEQGNNLQLADGIYDAECIDAKDDVSKAGNDMLVLNWRVFSGEQSVRVRDYIVSTAQWKLKQAMQACGMATDTEKEVVSDDFVGKSAKVSVVKDGEYNKIKAYIAAPVKEEIEGIPF